VHALILSTNSFLEHGFAGISRRLVVVGDMLPGLFPWYSEASAGTRKSKLRLAGKATSDRLPLGFLN
jgi:hypothetical protein